MLSNKYLIYYVVLKIIIIIKSVVNTKCCKQHLENFCYKKILQHYMI